MAKSSAAGPSVAATEQVAEYIRQLILHGELRPGQRLPPERDLVCRLGLSRTSVRAGLQALANRGVLLIRPGLGTFVADGPLVLDSQQFHFLSALHGFTVHEMFEVRRTLESGAAAMAAQRATGDDLVAMSDAVADMLVAVTERDHVAFLAHDVRFHHAVAHASGNPMLVSIINMVSDTFFEACRRAVHHLGDLHAIANAHRQIYRAIRAHDAAAASQRMIEHLLESERLRDGDVGGGQPGAPVQMLLRAAAAVDAPADVMTAIAPG